MKKRNLDIPKKPNAIFYFIAWCIIAPFIKIKYNVKYHRMKEKLQEPYVLISNHGNTVDPFLSACAVYPNRLNFVGGYAYAQKRSYGWLFRLAQAIPKFQYQIDLASIKQMIGIVKNGGNLALFPSGRLPTYGENEVVTPAVAKMLKMAKVNIYYTKIEGAYLSRPKWSKKYRRGRIDVTVGKLLSKEELALKSVEEVNELVQKTLGHNEFRNYQDKMQIEYKGKDLAEGIEQVLYMCPKCYKEYTISSKGNEVRCSSCGSVWHLNSKGYFEEQDIVRDNHDWSLIIKEKVLEEVQKEGFEMNDEAELRILEKGKEVIYGHGKIKLDKTGITYEGMFRGEEQTIFFSIEELISLPFRCSVNFEIAYNTDVIRFCLKDTKTITKWSLCVEALKKLEKQKSA